eukprot:366474-Chlamydomonas_euryale.AAC.14
MRRKALAGGNGTCKLTIQHQCRVEATGTRLPSCLYSTATLPPLHPCSATGGLRQARPAHAASGHPRCHAPPGRPPSTAAALSPRLQACSEQEREFEHQIDSLLVSLSALCNAGLERAVRHCLRAGAVVQPDEHVCKAVQQVQRPVVSIAVLFPAYLDGRAQQLLGRIKFALMLQRVC